jgi:hypothetical protein
MDVHRQRRKRADWIQMHRDRKQWAVGNTVMKLRSVKGKKFIFLSAINSFSKMNLFHGAATTDNEIQQCWLRSVMTEQGTAANDGH